MKKPSRLILFAVILPILTVACESEGTGPSPSPYCPWSWVSGSASANEAGTYGTRGIPASSNVPGARAAASTWADPQGKLWLFGGYGYDSTGYRAFLNDLWKFDPATPAWTWVSGSSAADQGGFYGIKGIPSWSNVPGARKRAVSWTDPQGKLWLFGGYGHDSTGRVSWLNDLWKFDPATLEWAWVSGSSAADQGGFYGIKGVPHPANVPGARESPSCWIDASGKLWLLGGFGWLSVDTMGYLNDLWSFDPQFSVWTWVAGPASVNQPGTYGAQGVASSANTPGARSGAVFWMDAEGTFWLFGGFGVDSLGNSAYLNDLWKHAPSTLEWTWISGSDTINQEGVYGTQGLPGYSNVPGARVGSVSWIDPAGKPWIFGGYGLDSAGNIDILNDLWSYDPTLQRWVWMSGSNSVNQPGIYGTQGTDDPSNVPGARQEAVSWIDPGGKLWLFGGNGLDASDRRAWLNDLWRYTRK